jgi:hypothetical protein
VISIRIVDSANEAIKHIDTYGSALRRRLPRRQSGGGAVPIELMRQAFTGSVTRLVRLSLRL